ncbi:MmcQ/YjbR family DNA-binding protein [Ferruginibacter yonginensis]|uniref:MmcQ/YjbR family DNA-binding protein n=1 Tax=Ferruginibacter yonginensis TaxID=1310416 RepID=A0ABV8QTY3_9BACT
MNVEALRLYALGKEGVIEECPFGPQTLVFKLHNKMFLLLALDAIPLTMNVKCDPDEAIALREQYPDVVIPGYHMNKQHWNTVLPQQLNSTLVKKMIDDSYALVNKKTGKSNKK